MLINSVLFWLMLIYMLINADWCWSILSNANWCREMFFVIICWKIMSKGVGRGSSVKKANLHFNSLHFDPPWPSRFIQHSLQLIKESQNHHHLTIILIIIPALPSSYLFRWWWPAWRLRCSLGHWGFGEGPLCPGCSAGWSANHIDDDHDDDHDYDDYDEFEDYCGIFYGKAKTERIRRCVYLRKVTISSLVECTISFHPDCPSHTENLWLIYFSHTYMR